MRSHDAADYANQMHQLMPVGLAWSRVRGSANERLIEGMAEEPARIEARAIYLALKEFYAQFTRELLPEWEEEYGLPDECTTLGVTYEERIEDLLRKIRSIGGQSIKYLIGVSNALGMDDITIDEFRPFRVGKNRVGDRLYSREWLFAFRINAPGTRAYWFRAGRNAVGDRLRYWRRNEILECIINRLKPAHKYAIFAYFDAGTLVDAFVYHDDGGNAILRDAIDADAVDPILELDGADVVIRGGLERDAESATLRATDAGGIIIKD